MSRIAEIRQNILTKNDLQAADLREQFAGARVTVVNLVSSPGSGKTALLEATLRALQPRYRVAVLVGDLATDRDALRLNRVATQVQQITTGTVCHLDSAMVAHAIANWRLSALDFLFIENVGNLVCPASPDVGETLRAVLMSVTEGEDKPLRYPAIFNGADVAIITKIDLAEAVHFERHHAHANIHEVSPSLAIDEVSSKTGEGLDAWLRRLEVLRKIVVPEAVNAYNRAS